MNKTPLFEDHIKAGARIVDFAGWQMPVQYIGLKEEHQNVRTKVGLFDVSHMGEIRIKGPKALATVEWLTTNEVSKLNDNESQYSLLPNDQGGLVDDLIVYCVKKNEDYLLCVNASNKDKDLAWIIKNNQGADITDESSYWGQIAVQGPKSFTLLQKVFKQDFSQMKKNTFVQLTYAPAISTNRPQYKAIIACTGYTGEKGVEVFIESTGTSTLWNDFLSQGKPEGVMPIGLGARDTLRTEMKYSLYGHEIDDTTNPFEAGLGWVIKASKKDFIGKSKILAKKDAGLTQQLIGFKLQDKGIPRQGFALFSFDNNEIGKVTSGTLSPSLNESIGIAYVQKKYAEIGTEILVDIRGRKAKAIVVETPFVKPTL